MRENRTFGSEGGEGGSLSLPLSKNIYYLSSICFKYSPVALSGLAAIFLGDP